MSNDVNTQVTSVPKYIILDTPSTVEGEKTSDTSLVMIQEGYFEGFTYHYGVVSFQEDDDADPEENGVLSYDYVLVEVPEEYEVTDEAKEQVDFENLIGEILVDIIINNEGFIGDDDSDDREPDIK